MMLIIGTGDNDLPVSGGRVGAFKIICSLNGHIKMLFLVGVVFFLKNIRGILRFITAFTLGHSLTLVSA